MIKLQLNDKQNIFFCSDPHYNHKGIVKGTSNWDDVSVCRNFLTVEDHNNTLVNNINNTVGKNDTLFCLGDWNFGNYKEGENVNGTIEFRNKLLCQNIHLILGNHDTEIRKSDVLQSYFSSVQDYLELRVSIPSKEQGVKARKQMIVMCHYSLRSWNKMHRGSYMLYGHSHGSLQGEGKSMDVGFDCHNEFRPFSFNEIDNILKNKEIIETDHHKNTKK